MGYYKDDMPTLERVSRITAEQLGVAEGEVLAGTKFIYDLGADSLDTVELVMAAEEEFEIEISDEEAGKIETVAQAVELIDRLVAGKGGR